ncbi:helix-turn-helix domain-containing protein [Fervidibacillus albus]|uniref:Helix-turn-helix domain-containing protein n=1 Tax=Fervidibacillus albus TaxID=2980026 RepID=A0A9E8RVZ9_9BACI|nr:helix-turn-helix transcriptional regulator [Fervidibacillus albus]WAA09779.1 helix-turn-helix domain-containing protein [Fervidibacillus albus]
MLGDRLIELRGKHTQKYVAEKLGISRARYSHYENNYVQPDYELLIKMADFYHVSVDYLLGRTDEKWTLFGDNKRFNFSNIPIDEVIEQYPITFHGKKLHLTEEDKWALLVFIETMQTMKNRKEKQRGDEIEKGD